MKLFVRGTTYEGRVVDLRCQPVDGGRIAAAVRGERCFPAVDAPPTTPVYDYCGRVHPAMGLRTKTALAAAARSRGYETAADDAIADLREKLAALDAAEPSLPPLHESVDDASLGVTEFDPLVFEQALDDDYDACMATLPDSWRATVQLVDVEGMTYEEAAAALDVPVGTIRSRLHRGRQRLYEALCSRLHLGLCGDGKKRNGGGE